MTVGLLKMWSSDHNLCIALPAVASLEAFIPAQWGLVSRVGISWGDEALEIFREGIGWRGTSPEQFSAAALGWHKGTSAQYILCPLLFSKNIWCISFKGKAKKHLPLLLPLPPSALPAPDPTCRAQPLCTRHRETIPAERKTQLRFYFKKPFFEFPTLLTSFSSEAWSLKCSPYNGKHLCSPPIFTEWLGLEGTSRTNPQPPTPSTLPPPTTGRTTNLPI